MSRKFSFFKCYMGVSKNGGTPKSSILIGFSIINHPFWGTTIFGNTHILLHQFFVKPLVFFPVVLFVFRFATRVTDTLMGNPD